MSDNELELQRETCERIRKEGVTWFGPITDWNIEAIADRLRLMLIGKRHTKAKLMTMFSPQDSMDLTTHLYVEEIKVSEKAIFFHDSKSVWYIDSTKCRYIVFSNEGFGQIKIVQDHNKNDLLVWILAIEGDHDGN